MSISKKLKDLIVAFGGAGSAAAIPGTRIDTLIGTLAALIGSGSSKMTPYEFDITVTEGEGGVLIASADTSFADVKAARTAGRIVQARVTPPGTTTVMIAPLSATDPGDDPTALIFSSVMDLSGPGETPAPTHYQAEFSADGVAVNTTALT